MRVRQLSILQVTGGFEIPGWAAFNLKHGVHSTAEIKIKQNWRGEKLGCCKVIKFNELLKICHLPDQVIWFSSQKVTEKWLKLKPGACSDYATAFGICDIGLFFTPHSKNQSQSLQIKSRLKLRIYQMVSLVFPCLAAPRTKVQSG